MLVKKGATIGANATIVCGVTIGSYAFVGAGAVFTEDIKDQALVVGNSPKQIGWVCECGCKLDGNFICYSCSKQFKEIQEKAMSS
jgi:UDP-2-acetamido-3-amino-2,3-dideoxy-glucuronate N-acetyltransferase